MMVILEILLAKMAPLGPAASASAVTTLIPMQLGIATAWQENVWSAFITQLVSTVTDAKMASSGIP